MIMISSAKLVFYDYLVIFIAKNMAHDVTRKITRPTLALRVFDANTHVSCD